MYHVIDFKTGADHGSYKTLRGAHRRADKLEAALGYVRYIVRWLNF